MQSKSPQTKIQITAWRLRRSKGITNLGENKSLQSFSFTFATENWKAENEKWKKDFDIWTNKARQPYYIINHIKNGQTLFKGTLLFD
jgi:hypothetical protein